MNERDLIQNNVSVLLGNIQYLIRLLYAVRSDQVRYQLLHDLWNQIGFLQSLINLLGREAAAPAPPAPLQPPTLPTISRAALSAYTGRNGNPAYVAVAGTIYDVTNHPGWSLGTHFGLPAGQDLTAEFARCHAGADWILSTLKPVGRLV